MLIPRSVSYTHLLLSFVIEQILHTDTFRKITFFHVFRVVQSESAVISNTIFFAMTILPFLKEYGSKMCLLRMKPFSSVDKATIWFIKFRTFSTLFIFL